MGANPPSSSNVAPGPHDHPHPVVAVDPKTPPMPKPLVAIFLIVALYRGIAEMGIGNSNIQRVANDMDGAEAHPHIDERGAMVGGIREAQVSR